MLDKNTHLFDKQVENPISVGDILQRVYIALKDKGYNPVNQIVGYIMSGDPTYITSYNNARSLIMKVERDELVEEVLIDFSENIKRRTGLPVELWDERLSTLEATDILKEAGIKVQDRKTYIDKIAASFILRRYMEDNA